MGILVKEPGKHACPGDKGAFLRKALKAALQAYHIPWDVPRGRERWSSHCAAAPSCSGHATVHSPLPSFLFLEILEKPSQLDIYGAPSICWVLCLPTYPCAPPRVRTKKHPQSPQHHQPGSWGIIPHFMNDSYFPGIWNVPSNELKCSLGIILMNPYSTLVKLALLLYVRLTGVK